MVETRQEDIVIVGGGICGLATALALHRKGIKSIVLEKSESLRTTGVGIIMQPNGWRALEELGVASILRQTAVYIHCGRIIPIHEKKSKDMSFESGETRCLKRNDLLKALAEKLPAYTVEFNREVESIKMDPITSNPILYLVDGSVVKAKIVIGCDGVNSVITRIIGINSTNFSPICVVRGFSYYEDGHDYADQFLVLSNNNHVQLGIMAVTHNLVYWFLTRKCTSIDSKVSRDSKLIKESSLEALKDFPQHALELVEKTDQESVHLSAGLRYRAPWDLLTSNFRKGTVTVAGDAMHAMGPFLAQGGSASLEDAVILAKCLAEKFQNKAISKEKVEEALDKYLKLRKRRVFWLCLQTYLIGIVIQPAPLIKKVLCILLLIILFRDPESHSRYDCRKS